jgi:hypothetical protein
VDNLLENRRRRRGVDHHTGALAQRLDPLHGTVQVVVALPVNEQRVGAGRSKFVKQEVRG